MPTILIVNAVALNGGDRALLEALVARVHDAYGEDVEIRVADATPQETQRAFPSFRVFPTVLGVEPRLRLGGRVGAAVERPLRLALRAVALRALLPVIGKVGVDRVLWALPSNEREAVRAYRGADVVISSGGTNLVEHYRLTKRWLSLEVAVRLRAPLVLFTQSLGPFTSRRNIRAMRRYTGYASFVSLRDARSLDHLREVGCRTDNAQVDADAAFGLEYRLPAPHTADRLRVAVSVRHWPYAEAVQGRDTTADYRASISAAVVTLVRDLNAEVVFVSTCQGDAAYEDDSAEAAKIAAQLPADVSSSVTVDRGYHAPEELVSLLATMDAVIGTRMHFCILSLVAGLPVLPIAYEFKTAELFAALGLGELPVLLEDIEPTSFVGEVRSFVEKRASYRVTLQGAVAEQRQAALAIVPRFEKVLSRA